MKFIIKLMSVLILFSGILAAQGIMNRSSVKVNAGLSIPNAPNDFSNYWNSGISFGASISTPIISNLSLEPGLYYQSFPFNEESFINDVGGSGYSMTTDGGSASALLLLIDFKMNLMPNNSAHLYLLAGGGYFEFDIESITMRAGGKSVTVNLSDDNGFAWNIGGGLDFGVAQNYKLFLEVRYVSLLTENEATGIIPVKAGLSFLL